MSFNFFKKQPLLEEDTILWMFDNFAWALKHFDVDVFFNETILVVPSNALFPGRAENPHEMAGLIFDRVKEYAGMSHWPCRLMDEVDVSKIEPPRLMLEGAVRGAKGIKSPDVDEAHQLVITYNSLAINDPEVMIANYAHVLAHYLASLSTEAPPGGTENWPHVTELLAAFLGFGLIMANTAHTAKIRSCGSCSGPAVERTNYLSQMDMTYALALFCTLKEIPASKVKSYLKASLWPFYKKACKDIKGRDNEISRLREVTKTEVAKKIDSKIETENPGETSSSLPN